MTAVLVVAGYDKLLSSIRLSAVVVVAVVVFVG